MVRIDDKRSSERFWQVADHFREVEVEWIPTNAGYERQCLVEFDGKSWTVCLKIHVIPVAHETGEMWLGFKASVTIWPPPINEQDERRLARKGWYAASKRALLRRGYRGKWSESPSGKWGDFWKDLHGVVAVRREAKRLDQIPVALSALNQTAAR